MNLVEQIKDRLSQESAGKLGSLIGEGEGKTKAALAAAVPALLAALASLTANTAGAAKLAGTVGKFEPDLASRLNGMTTGQAQAVLEEGTAALGALFAGSTLSALADALARNTDLSADKVKKLLGYLAALVLGELTGALKGQSATAASLASLFGDQKENLASAMPAGLSLDRVPGVGKDAPASGVLANVLLAILFFVVIVVVGWYFFTPPGFFGPKDAAKGTSNTSKQ